VMTPWRCIHGGERQDWLLQVPFKASLKVDLPESRITSGHGLVPVLELDERLRLTDLIQQQFTESWGEEHAFAARGPAAPVGMLPPGGIRCEWILPRAIKDLQNHNVGIYSPARF